MKKISLAILVMTMLALMLCACGNVQDELDGTTWKNDMNGAGVVWSFSGDRVSVYNYIDSMEFGHTEGAYEAADGVISFTWDEADSGRVAEIYYDDTDGIVLYADKAHTTKLVKS